MNKKVYLAVDLGAGSGRLIATLFDGKKIELTEISRWKSEAEKRADGLHWNVGAIVEKIKHGVKKARVMFGNNIVSLGIDSWAVDYGLLDSSDKLINDPFVYRDSRTKNMMEKVFSIIDKNEIYSQTGIQFLFFNTLYQLMAENFRDDKTAARAKTFLMMPDLIAFALTGRKTNERTNASSTQLYNPNTRDWAHGLIDKLSIPSEIFSADFVECGDPIGTLTKELKDELGDLKVVAVASHDTASAVVATPSAERNPTYINSGTWSLPGLELDETIINEDSLKENFTNEVGAENTVRFLKNVTGMWLVQQCKEVWKKEKTDLSYAELENAARNVKPMLTLFDPDCADFAAPSSMPHAIATNCAARIEKAPQTHGEFFRAIQENIALKYACVFETLEKLSGKKINSVNVMGGGSRDEMLNQFTANACNRPILAGPVESTALGNAIIQMKADRIIADIREGRSLIAKSFQPKIFEPDPSSATMWKENLDKFKKII